MAVVMLDLVFILFVFLREGRLDTLRVARLIYLFPSFPPFRSLAFILLYFIPFEVTHPRTLTY